MAAALKRMLMRGRGREEKEAEDKKEESKPDNGESLPRSSERGSLPGSSERGSIAGSSERGSASSSTAISSESRGASSYSGGDRHKDTDFSSILDDEEACEEFRVFLRTTLDMNKSADPFHKKKFEIQLDFLLISRQIFSAAEEDLPETLRLMVDIGDRFLARPPAGYNLALGGQRNREDLVRHCKNLREGVEHEVDSQILRPGYEFIYAAVSKKYDLYIKTRPRTTLQILCAII